MKVFLTGGSRGIGKVIKTLLEGQGHVVFSPGREELNLQDPLAIDRFFEGFSERDQIEALINVAGMNTILPFEAITPNSLESLFQVNLKAPLVLIQKVLPGMKTRHFGRIVNISSIWSQVSREGRTQYAMAKSALNALTRSLALELAPIGVLVNAVAPGYVATEMTRQNNSPEELERIVQTIPLGRLAEPEEIAHLVSFLISPSNSYMTGQTIFVDGGYTCR